MYNDEQGIYQRPPPNNSQEIETRKCVEEIGRGKFAVKKKHYTYIKNAS